MKKQMDQKGGSVNNQNRKKYKKDFLEQVIARVDFDTPLQIKTDGPPESIYATVRDRFPITEGKKVLGKEFLIGPDVITKERSVETMEWHYYGKDREKRLLISPDMMFIVYSKYEYFERLEEDFLSVLNALFDAFPKIQIKRLGLRYVNKIEIKEGDPTDWDEYIKPGLNTIFSIADDKKTISRAFHILELKYDEDMLRFQFGMFNPDYPAPIKKKIYTLDYDMYAAKLLDKNEIRESLSRFHEKINKSFEEVITDKLREKMEPING